MSNLPLGAENDPRAPYNQDNIKSVNVDVTVSITLSKDLNIETTDYTPIELSELDVDADDIDRGDLIEPNFEDTNWEQAYLNSSIEYSLIELLNRIKIIAEAKIKKYNNPILELDKKEKVKMLNYWKKIYRSCDKWTIDDIAVIKND